MHFHKGRRDTGHYLNMWPRTITLTKNLRSVWLNRGRTFGSHLKHFHHKKAKYNSDIQQSWWHLTCMKTLICQLLFCLGLCDPEAGSSRPLCFEFMSHAVPGPQSCLRAFAAGAGSSRQSFWVTASSVQARQMKEGGERPCWTQKAASHNNVAVAVTYYFLSFLPIFSVPLTYFASPLTLSSEKEWEQIGGEAEEGSNNASKL